MPRMKAVTTVTWSEWDDRTKRMEHKTLHPANPVRGTEAEVADVPDEVVARVEKIRAEELRLNERRRSGRSDGHPIDHRAGHVRWLPEDEYDEYMSSAVTPAAAQAFTDEQIAGWDADATIAHMNQDPSLARRVLDLEDDRKPRRRAVAAHAQRLIDAQDGEDVSLADADTDAQQPLTPAEGA